MRATLFLLISMVMSCKSARPPEGDAEDRAEFLQQEFDRDVSRTVARGDFDSDGRTDALAGATSRPGAPSRQELIEIALSLAAEPLPDDESCAGLLRRHPSPTVGAYLASLLKWWEEDDMSNHWVATSAERTTRDGVEVWHCNVLFMTSDPEGGSDYGLRFDLRADGQGVVEGSIGCPGSP